MEKLSIDIAEELARLSMATIFELRGEWRRLHRAPPPMRLSRDLLMRAITYKLQERPLVAWLGAPPPPGTPVQLHHWNGQPLVLSADGTPLGADRKSVV